MRHPAQAQWRGCQSHRRGLQALPSTKRQEHPATIAIWQPIPYRDKDQAISGGTAMNEVCETVTQMIDWISK